MSEVTTISIKEFAASLSEQPASRELAMAVLRNLFKFAVYKEIIARNIMNDLGLELEASPKRDQVWSKEQIRNLLIAAANHSEGSALVLGIIVMLYTAQRPGDCLSLTWANWTARGIELVQQKTAKPVKVWCHVSLLPALQEAKKRAKGLRIIADRVGRPITLKRFRGWYDEACAAAGIDGMQLRDLRRTAVVRMAEQGAEIPMIASVTGHSYSNAHQILETYLPRSTTLARSAIETWSEDDDAQEQGEDKDV